MSLKILISGSTGFVGKNLSNYLQSKGFEIYPLLRKKNNDRSVFWDPEKNIFDWRGVKEIDAVVNLCGESVAALWTKKKKKRIYESRVHSTQFLIDSLKKEKRYPKVVISASAIGYYGNKKDEILRENSLKGEGFLSDVCEDWERAANEIKDQSRVITLRFGHILGKNGGMLPKLARIYRWGLGGKMGSGNQYMSWISIEDICEIIFRSLTQEDWSGPINCVSMSPVLQKEFGKALAEILHRPFWFHTPEMCLRLFLKEQAEEMFLASQRAVSEKLNQYGYTFIDTDLKKTLQKYLPVNSC